MYHRVLTAVVTGTLLFFFVTGCGPTFPKEKFKESIIDLCKREYKLDVKVETIGKTIAIYLPLSDLIDFNFSVTKSAGEKINDVILSVSRVALSSNAEYDFYCIIAHDVRMPEIQIIIIKSVDDVKRFLLNDISRSDYSKRMLIDIRMSPQAQKERSVKEIFEKIAVDKKTQEQVMSDFFRSEPTALADIGYWNNRFYIKDVTLSEFLAEQMANRVRIEFREDKDLIDNFLLRVVKGAYVSGNKKYFKIEILADPKTSEWPVMDASSEKLFASAVKVAAKVIRSYRFDDFDHIEIINLRNMHIAKVSKEDLERFRKKEAGLEEILKQ